MLVVGTALLAGGALLLTGMGDDPPVPPPQAPVRVTAAAAWQGAEQSTVPGTLPDGSEFTPGHFLDARTAVGAAPGPGGRTLRLVLRHADGSIRQLRSLPPGGDPIPFASSATDLVWAEGGNQLWAADLRLPRSPARLVTSDLGPGVFTGSPFDLVLHDGKVSWAVRAADAVTEIRSVPVTGGRVTVRAEKGFWGQSAWPWLTDGSDQTSTARLRDLTTGRDTEVTGSGTELLTCGPAWCRVAVVEARGITRLELMRHDGSGRVAIAGGTATSAGTEVAVLDRFALLFETRAVAGQQNTATLLAYDIALASLVEISPSVTEVFTRGGVVWWSTTSGRSRTWHAVDLRTV